MVQAGKYDPTLLSHQDPTCKTLNLCWNQLGQSNPFYLTFLSLLLCQLTSWITCLLMSMLYVHQRLHPQNLTVSLRDHQMCCCDPQQQNTLCWVANYSFWILKDRNIHHQETKNNYLGLRNNCGWRTNIQSGQLSTENIKMTQLSRDTFMSECSFRSWWHWDVLCDIDEQCESKNEM